MYSQFAHPPHLAGRRGRGRLPGPPVRQPRAPPSSWIARNSFPVNSTHCTSPRAGSVWLFSHALPSFVTASSPACPPTTNTPFPNATRCQVAFLSVWPAIWVTVTVFVFGSNATAGP